MVAKVEWYRGELFPRVGFIVTNMTAGPEGVVRFYNGRGTAEQWIKEGKYALNWARLSCHRFVAQPGASISVSPGVQPWEFPSPAVSAQGGQALVAAERAGEADQRWEGRLVQHARRLVFQLSEVSVPRRLFQGVVDRIGRLSPAPS